MESLTTTFLEESLKTRTLLGSALAIFLSYVLFYLVADNRTIPGFEVVGKEDGEWLNTKARQRFAQNSKELVQIGMKKFQDKIFQVYIHSGPQLIMPVKYIDEVRNHPHLNFKGTGKLDFFTHYPAFKSMEAGIKGDVFIHMINRKLTTSLALVTEPVNEENNIALKQLFPEMKEWTPTPFVSKALLLTSQVSSRIFLGDSICRNPDWIRLAKDYTVDLITAAYTMRYTPSLLRPVLYYVLPPISKLKATVKAASAIVEPEIQKRRQLRAEALARGEQIPKRLDSLDWFDEVSQDRRQSNYDVVGAQLSLTFVAVHTTSNTLAHLLYDLVDNPELIPELRQEIIDVMEEDKGWQKTSLYKLKLLDSVMKESQRINVMSHLLMNRIAQEDVTLSDGTFIPKYSRLSIPTLHMNDDKFYPNADTFEREALPENEGTTRECEQISVCDNKS